MSCRSVSAHEIDKFRKLQQHWWNPTGALATLHQLNPHRVRYIQNSIKNFSTAKNVANPLAGKRVLDVGCGGGILSESLARLGADVTGVDMCEESIAVAKQRFELVGKQQQQPMTLQFHAKSVFEIENKAPVGGAKKGGGYDIVVASEVLEHVEDPSDFVAHLCSLVNTDGLLMCTTLNKTLFSGLVYVGMAEGSGVVPPGTHDWGKFIPPQDLTECASRNDVSNVDLTGVVAVPNIARSLFSGTVSSDFKLVKGFTAGHYFWTGVKLPSSQSSAGEGSSSA